MLGATAAGVAAVLSFHSRSQLLASAAAKGAGPAHHGASPATAPKSTTPTTAGRTGSTPPGGSTVTSSPPTTAAGTAVARTAVGKLENYGYGHLAVQVTVQGSKLTSLSVRTLATAEPYSQQLAVQVLPLLRQQAEKVQSAKIYGISGATYTSEAYALSLQSALDKLHFR